MSRAYVGILSMMLLLVPVMAFGQRPDTDRSRSKTESRRVEVDRSAKRAEAVKREANEKDEKSDRARVREDKVSRNSSARVESRNRTKAGSGPKSGQDGGTKARTSDSDRRGPANRNDRSTRVVDKPSRNKEVKHRQSKPADVKHSPVRHKQDKHRSDRSDHRKVTKRQPRPIVHKRPVRHAHKRYVYKPRRYHRHHGLSIGFYIRIPTVRWHVGHTRRYAYRQIVSGHPAGDVEVVSTFKRKIRGVHREYVDVEFELDRIEVVSRGLFLGEVDRFPGDLRKMRAKIYRDGFVQFDRMLYVVGNEYSGFELLSTRYCGGDLTRAAYECLDVRAGAVDFYDERVHCTRYSELLDLALTGHAVPVALIPDEEYLGFQYVVGYGRPSDGYYSGTYDYSSLSRYDRDGTAYRLSSGDGIAGFETADGTWAAATDEDEFVHSSVVSYPGENGAALELNREIEIHSVE